MQEADERFIKQVIEVSGRARENGNPPFGALLVDSEGNVLLEEENTTLTANDITAHPELTVAKLAAQKYDPEFLATTTMYASTEPCGMCTYGLYNAGIGRVVFALSAATLREKRGNPPESLTFSCAEIIARGGRDVEVIGPVAEEEALAKFEGMF